MSAPVPSVQADATRSGDSATMRGAAARARRYPTPENVFYDEPEPGFPS
jgi:hypothetical protein